MQGSSSAGYAISDSDTVEVETWIIARIKNTYTGDTENALYGRTAEREALNNDAPDITAWDAEEDKGGDIIQN